MNSESMVFMGLPGILYTMIAAAVFLIVRHQNLQRYRVRLELIQKERLAAMDKGVPMPELPDYDDARVRPSFLSNLRINPKWPLGLGAILILGGIGVTIALYLSAERDQHAVWSMGIVPIFVGFGLLLHYRLTR